MERIVLVFKKPLMIALAAVTIAGAAVAAYLRFSAPQPLTVTVKRGDLIASIAVAGNTKPVTSVELGFDQPGTVRTVTVAVGDSVKAGQMLVALDSGDLAANLAQAQANVDAEQAKLNTLRLGARPEDIAVSQAAVDTARSALADAMRSLADKTQDAYTKSDDAVRNVADQLFTNPRGSAPHFNIFVVDPQLRITIENERADLEGKLIAWQASLSSGTDSSASGTATAELAEVRQYIDNVSLALNAAAPNGTYSQTNLDTWRGNLSSARTNIGTAIANLSAAVASYQSAGGALSTAQRQLELKKAGPTADDLASQLSRVAQMEATVENARAQLAKRAIIAPISGVVTQEDAKVGGFAVPNTPLVSIISASDLEVEAHVPEIHIGKVKIGDTASITLDAFPDETFDGKVTYIDPAETLIDGVVNYKVTVIFDKFDRRLKSGLTANVAIVVAKKADVLALPKYALETSSGVTKAMVLMAGKEHVVTVTTGMEGDAGLVEAVSGLNEGDLVVLPTAVPASTQ